MDGWWCCEEESATYFGPQAGQLRESSSFLSPLPLVPSAAPSSSSPTTSSSATLFKQRTKIPRVVFFFRFHTRLLALSSSVSLARSHRGVRLSHCAFKESVLWIISMFLFKPNYYVRKWHIHGHTDTFDFVWTKKKTILYLYINGPLLWPPYLMRVRAH